MDAPQVVAAWIAAGAAILAAAINVTWNLIVERRRRDAELIVKAFEHFQGSQRRSVGMATLAILKERSAWNTYRDTICQLFYAQLLYLLSHGDNRWQAHEIANIELMADWLVVREVLPPPTNDMKKRLRAAVEKYKNDWKNLSTSDRKKHGADDDSVAYLIDATRKWKIQP